MNDQSRGVIIGLLIGALGFGGYVAYDKWSGDGLLPERQPETPDLLQYDAETLESIRSHPEDLYMHARDEELPLFVAFLDYNVEATDPVIEEYKRYFDRISAYYVNDTPKQIVHAIFDIHGASTVVGPMTYLECMEKLLATVPSGFDPATARTQPRQPVREVAAAIHRQLVDAYYEPIIQAELAEQQSQQAEAAYQAQLKQQIDAQLQRNLAAMRERGAARNLARDVAQAQRNRIYQQQVEWAYRDFQRRLAQDENLRRRWQRWHTFP